MDTLRGNFEALDDSREQEAGEDDSAREAPPLGIGQDERRMQVRAYNHWAGLLEDRNFPSIDDLEPDNLPDFGPFSVLLDFSVGIENPGVAYLGNQLAHECDISVPDLRTLSDVPSRSLLSRITDHYMQILANQAPIGFEAEFVNQRGATILYRGILLPYSSNDETIDFIYGVINWKELADQRTSDELLLQVDQALETKPEASSKRADDTPLTDWADGPGTTTVANDIDDEPLELSLVEDEPVAIYEAETEEAVEDEDLSAGFAEGLPAFSGRAEDYLDDEEYEEEEEDEDGVADSLPKPKFGSLMSIGGGRGVPAEVADDGDGLDEIEGAPYAPGSAGDGAIEMADFEYADDAVMSLGGFELSANEATGDFSDFDDADHGSMGNAESVESGEEETLAAIPAGGAIRLAPLEPSDMALGDWLTSAREMAAQARTSEDRTRHALYDAIGRAYDFSLAAAQSPEDFEELVSDSGLSVQDRAPMTPVVKLVFGADYDKTRLTEYAAALSHAHRLELARGSLGDFLRGAEGGLKGVVRAERQLRRADSGKADPAADSRELLAAKLREMPAVALADLDRYGSEFGLVMIRRSEDGDLVIIGEVPEDATLIEKAAKKLVG